MGDTHCLPFEANRRPDCCYIFSLSIWGGGNAQTHTTEHTDTSPKTVPGRRSFLTLQVRSSAQTRGLWLNDRQAEKRCGLLIEWRSRSVNGVLLASGHHTTRIPWRGGAPRSPVAGHPGRLFVHVAGWDFSGRPAGRIQSSSWTLFPLHLCGDNERLAVWMQTASSTPMIKMLHILTQ